MFFRQILATLGVVAILSVPLAASAQEPLHEAIDRLIAAGTPDFDAKAAPVADDAEFLRRVYLDLTGTIPPIDRTRAFLADGDPDKRAKLIDELLASPQHARHLQRVIDVDLMRRLPASKVKAEEWQAFLRESFAANKPWDQLVREILAADGLDEENRGPARFYLDRNGDVNEITRDVASEFLGADLECAQCHDHPEIADYEITDYYGLSAFFVRSFVFTDPKSKQAVYAEKAEGEVTFKSVFLPDSEDQSTPPHLFDGEPVADPKLEKGKEYEVKPKKNVRPVPVYSRREQLPERLATAENERFRRAAANRFWAMMLGRGIVHPIDRDHPDNPPSHPELLDLLSNEFAAHGFDVKWLLREIALSDTYQRSSRLPESVTEPLPESAFAQAILKPLSPEQFAWSFLEAVGTAEVNRAGIEAAIRKQAEEKKETLDDAELARRLDRQLFDKLKGYESRFASLFGGEPGKPPEDFESTVEQVMFLMNDGTILNHVKPNGRNLVGRLVEIPADDHQALAEELFLSTLVRQPTPQDVEDVQAYLAGVSDEERPELLGQLAWALVTSSEFRFVH